MLTLLASNLTQLAQAMIGASKVRHMKTTYFIPDIVRTVIVAHYGEDRAKQIERACNGARQDTNTVSQSAPGMKRGDMKGGHSINQKGTLTSKAAKWEEVEKITYTVEKSTAPLEMVKFTDALLAMYRRCGSLPSGELSIGIVPKFCRDWFDTMSAKAEGTAGANKRINKRNKASKVKPLAPGEIDGAPASETTPANVPA
jgi:hypothetical protein